MIYSFNYHVSIAFIAGFTERIAKVIQPFTRESEVLPVKNDPADKSKKTEA